MFIAIYTFCSIISDGENRLLNSNELGDFLAGTFAPLAFLFLYLGYKQNSEALKMQGEELKLSTAALQAQVKEMQESVAEQKVMTEILKTELEEKHISLTPILELYPAFSDEGYYKELRYNIKNSGESSAKNVRLTLIDTHREFKTPVLLAQQTKGLYFKLAGEDLDKYNNKQPIEHILSLEYESVLGRNYIRSFLYTISHSDGEVMRDLKEI